MPTSWSRPPHSSASSSGSLTRMTLPMSTAISLTLWLCRAVYGSRLSTAAASAPIVCVNMSRISTNRCDAIRVVYSGKREQQGGPPLDGVDERHEPAQRRQGDVVEGGVPGIAADHGVEGLPRPKCKQRHATMAVLSTKNTPAASDRRHEVDRRRFCRSDRNSARQSRSGQARRRWPEASRRRGSPATRTKGCAPELADFGCANCRHPTGDSWATQGHRRDEWSHRHGLVRPKRQA